MFCVCGNPDTLPCQVYSSRSVTAHQKGLVTQQMGDLKCFQLTRRHLTRGCHLHSTCSKTYRHQFLNKQITKMFVRNIFITSLNVIIWFECADEERGCDKYFST